MKGYRLFNKVKWFGMFISGLSVFIMMLYTTIDVMLRNFWGISILHSYELSQYYFMPLAVFPALAYAFGEEVMPRIDMIINKLNKQYQYIIAIFLIIIELILLALLGWYGFEYFIRALAIGDSFTAGTTYFPLSIAIIFVPIGFLMVIIETVFLLVKNIKQKNASYSINE